MGAPFLFFVFALSPQCDAQVRAGLYVPPPPPIAGGPVSRQLVNAYHAVLGAPSSLRAQNANAAYIAALQAAARGDRSGALAAAAAAQAAALLPGQAPQPGPLPLASRAPAPLRAVPIVSGEAAAASDPDLGSAANEIAIAGDSGAGGTTLEAAKKHYRAALDAFQSGDAPETKIEARRALELATEAVTKRK